MNIIEFFPSDVFNKYSLVYKLSVLEISSYIRILLNKLTSLDILLNNCVGIALDLRPKTILDKIFGDIEEEDISSGHKIAFIKCNDKLYFYDNNGIMEYEREDDPSGLRKSGHKLVVEFDWIKYLKNKIAFIIPVLKMIMSLDDYKYKLELFKHSILAFSDFIRLTIPAQNMPYGRSYLRDMCISSFQVITVENLSTEEKFNELTKEINDIYLSAYINTKVLKLKPGYVDEAEGLYDD